jgi:hypothetical protein
MTRITSWGALVCLLAATTSATTFPTTTTGDLVVKAERVCCARCESVETRVDPKTGLVFTHVRLRRLEDLKGSGSGDTIHLRLVGGRSGDRITSVPGMPRFEQAQESILLLGRRNRLGYRVVLQARRGVVPLRKDKQGRRWLAHCVTGMPGLRGDRPVRLDEFRDSLKRKVEEAERRKREERASR